jgi:hypothetical protein
MRQMDTDTRNRIVTALGLLALFLFGLNFHAFAAREWHEWTHSWGDRHHHARAERAHAVMIDRAVAIRAERAVAIPAPMAPEIVVAPEVAVAPEFNRADLQRRIQAIERQIRNLERSSEARRLRRELEREWNRLRHQLEVHQAEQEALRFQEWQR